MRIALRGSTIRRPASRVVAFALSVAVATVAGGCSDPFAVKAQSEVKTDSFAVFAMTGTPPGFPSALNIALRTLVRMDPSFNFDIAFDIDSLGRAVLVPVDLVAGTATPNRQLGVAKITTTFDQLTAAPTGGYAFDSVFVLSKGEGVVTALGTSQCQLFANPFLYSKLAVDSIDATKRVVFFHMVHDPNCGFRSFAPGIPTK